MFQGKALRATSNSKVQLGRGIPVAGDARPKERPSEPPSEPPARLLAHKLDAVFR